MTNIKIHTDKYCVYIHTINGEIIYIGKGRGYRAFDSNKRNKKWVEKVSKSGFFDVEIISWHSLDSEARVQEAKLIRKLNPLCNDIHSINYTTSNKQKLAASIAHKGKVISEETKLKISLGMAGKIPHNKGKAMSEDQILKLKKSQRKKANPVMCATINKKFESTRDAARELKIPPSTLRSHLAGKSLHAGGMIFYYV